MTIYKRPWVHINALISLNGPYLLSYCTVSMMISGANVTDNCSVVMSCLVLGTRQFRHAGDEIIPNVYVWKCIITYNITVFRVPVSSFIHIPHSGTGLDQNKNGRWHVIGHVVDAHCKCVPMVGSTTEVVGDWCVSLSLPNSCFRQQWLRGSERIGKQNSLFRP